MKQNLRLREELRSFHNQLKYKRRLALKLSALCFSLITVLFCVCLAQARQQEGHLPAANGLADNIQPLSIGDTIPDALWNLPLQLVKAGQEGSTTAKLQDYKGKLIILDFWATWCAPCVAAFPKMDSLRKKFSQQIAILPVTDQDDKTVRGFFANMQQLNNNKGFSIISGHNLRSYFPHRYIPHYVWIDHKGIVRQITDAERVTDANIEAMLTDTPLVLKEKRDTVRSFDFNELMLAESNRIAKASILGHSVLAEYVQGVTARYGIKTIPNTELTRLYAFNVPLLILYKIAYSELHVDLFHNSRIKMQVAQPELLTTDEKGDAYLAWARQHTYTYEYVSKGDTSSLFAHMREDLANHFNYDVRIEKQLVPCLVVKRKNSEINLRSAGGERKVKYDAFSFMMQNAPWPTFTQRLSVYFLQALPYPLIDETGIKENVDLNIHADMSDPESLRKELNKIGLDLVKEKRNIDIILIKDRPQH